MKYLYLVEYFYVHKSTHSSFKGAWNTIQVIAKDANEAIKLTEKNIDPEYFKIDILEEVQKLTKLNPINPEALNA